MASATSAAELPDTAPPPTGLKLLLNDAGLVSAGLLPIGRRLVRNDVGLVSKRRSTVGLRTAVAGAVFATAVDAVESPASARVDEEGCGERVEGLAVGAAGPRGDRNVPWVHFVAGGGDMTDELEGGDDMTGSALGASEAERCCCC